jgi:hypothetical protein
MTNLQSAFNPVAGASASADRQRTACGSKIRQKGFSHIFRPLLIEYSLRFPGKAGARAVPKKNVLQLISVSGLFFCFMIVYSFSTLGDSFIEESHMVMVHEFGDQEVQPNIRP